MYHFRKENRLQGTHLEKITVKKKFLQDGREGIDMNNLFYWTSKFEEDYFKITDILLFDMSRMHDRFHFLSRI